MRNVFFVGGIINGNKISIPLTHRFPIEISYSALTLGEPESIGKTFKYIFTEVKFLCKDRNGLCLSIFLRLESLNYREAFILWIDMCIKDGHFSCNDGINNNDYILYEDYLKTKGARRMEP